MLTIKMLCDIEKLNRESRLPNSLVEYLEKTIREMHEAYESETEFALFSLEMYGPIYVLQAGLDNPAILRMLGIGLPSNESGIIAHPEWVEKIDLGDQQFWRIGIMTDNDYLFQVILPVNEFGPDVEQWLDELSKPVTL